MKYSAGLTIILTTAITPATLYGLGLRVPDQDSKAIARGNAFVATADNPSAIYYNPAGITQHQGNQASLGNYMVTLGSEHRAINGTMTRTDDNFHMLPQLYYSYASTNCPFAGGLGFYSPYGLGLAWPNSTAFRQVTTLGEMTYLTFNPVIAWQALPTLSIAAGPTINFGETDLRRGVLASAAGDQFKFAGDDTALGFNAGLLWKPHEKHAVGLTYRSATTMDFEGSQDLAVPPIKRYTYTSARAEIDFPQQVVVGYSFRPTPRWNLEFDLDWTDWDSLNTVYLKTGSTSTAIPFNWQSSFMYEFGATYNFDQGYSLSAGYIFSENSVPSRYFTPAIPDSDRHIFSVGVGKQFKRLRMDAAYQFAWGPARDISGSVSGGSVSGRYEFMSHALALSTGINF